ncbi:MAG: hypothetical protein D6706_07550, partial [Chloroflexi bacterium]
MLKIYNLYVAALVSLLLMSSSEAQLVFEWSVDVPYQNTTVIDRGGHAYAVETHNPSTTITKYDPNGEVAWTRVLTLGPKDQATMSGTDSLGNLYVIGVKEPDDTTYNGSDMFVRKLSPSGAALATTEVSCNGSCISWGSWPTPSNTRVTAGGQINYFGTKSQSNSFACVVSSPVVGAISPNGGLVWLSDYGNAGWSVEHRDVVSVDDHGGQILYFDFAVNNCLRRGCIDTTGCEPQYEHHLVKFDSSGSQVWRQTGFSAQPDLYPGADGTIYEIAQGYHTIIKRN